ncbi:glycoside hydrolase domain-containing protein [candidate division KSB1 bacterium]
MVRILLLSLLSLALLAPLAQAEVELYVLPPEVKVKKLQSQIREYDYLWSRSDNTVKLAGCGQETVPFQIVVACRNDALQDVTLQWSDLKSEVGVIPGNNISAYLAALVKVYAKSGRAGEAGWWPDPLAPLSGPVDIRPDRFENSKNQTFWIDVNIPPDQAAGEYMGEISVTAAGKTLDTFPIRLTVWDFTLHPYSDYYNLFNCSRGWLAGYYTEEVRGDRSLDDVLVQYFDFMLSRDVQPWFNPLLQPECREVGDDLELRWNNQKWEKHLLDHPAYKRVTFSAAPDFMDHLPPEERFTPTFNRKIKKYVGAIYEHYRDNGWENKLTFFGPLDEPKTRSDYEELIRWGELVKSISPDLSFQVTEQPLPEDPSWPPLSTVADDWVVHGSYLESNRDALQKLIDQGNHACWYISCDQTYPMSNYFIDRSGVDPRAVPWITRRYRLQGILYWAVNFWREVKSPWRDPVTWKLSECNAPLAGEGSLLYPGEEIESYCRLANVDGPVSSTRFELLREGLEDIRYLEMLSRMGKDDDADRLAADLIISVFTFSRDPARYAKVRAEAARLIAAVK